MFYILDTETSGISKADQIVELAWLQLPALETIDGSLSAGNYPKFLSRYLPTAPIHPAAQAVHGISLGDLQECPPVLEQIPQDYPADAHYLIGHNISFDSKMLTQCGVDTANARLICTLSMAKKLYPVLPEGLADRKLTTLAKFLYPEYIEEIDAEAHSGMGDCLLVLLILEKFIERSSALTWDDLYQWQLPQTKPKATSTRNSLMQAMPFGKFKGEAFDEIEPSYLQWLSKQELSPKLRTTVEHWLGVLA